jgi:alpha/beta superfamily hydrolase
MPNLDLNSDAGRLAAIHDPPKRALAERNPRAAIVCHPHPLHGGTMDNKVVYTVAKTLAEEGLHVVRFNFRGVEDSAGEYDAGVGEQRDARAAMDHAAALVGGGPQCLLVAGFSFGSWVGLQAALGDERVAGLLAVAPPVNFYDYSAIATAAEPLSVIYGLQDELVPAQDVQAWLGTLKRPHLATAVEQAGHLFHARLAALRDGVRATLRSLHA